MPDSLPDSAREPRFPSSPPSIPLLWVAGTLLLWGLYACVFVATGHDAAGQAVVHAFANVLPLSLLAVAVRAVLKAEVMRRSPLIQAAWHAGLAIGFAFAWYATLLVCLALLGQAEGYGFVLEAFSGRALTWQVFQGLILYAAIAAVCYAVRGGREAAQVTIVTEASRPAPLTRYLVRRGDEMRPVAVAEIVSISGAQDYAEVATRTDRHLVRLSLGEFEARLDSNSFVRVHRSTIIHLAQLERTEPAGGGRLLAHMTNGDVVQVSRAGAQELRRFMVG